MQRTPNLEKCGGVMRGARFCPPKQATRISNDEFPRNLTYLHHPSIEPSSYAINNMKVITTTPVDTKTTAPPVQHSPTTAIPPSSTEDEAKSKFISALEKGVDKLLSRGHGRDRISEELLNEIANGCSPNENEVGV